LPNQREATHVAEPFMQSSSLALLAALAATPPAALAVPTFVGHMPVMAEDFADTAEPLHDQRWHALVHGQPSFAQLAVAAPAPGLVVSAEHALAPDRALPLAIPEPQTWSLTLAGLAALGFLARRRR
jgi:hypothetical protein